MTIWFNKKDNGKKKYCSKSISIAFHPKHWRFINISNNGAIKGKDSCYDLNIHFLGVFFSYTNWEYTIIKNK